MEREVSEALRRRVTEITTEWHDALCAHMAIRPEAVFPTDELLDHMDLVVEHIIGLLETDDEVPPRTLEALRDVAEYWQRAGYSVEEALLHFRILNRIMHQELGDWIRATDRGLDPEAAAGIAASLSHGSGLVQVVVVGVYRDRAEQRIADHASMLSHEVRGPISAGLAALQTIAALGATGGDQAEAKRREALERVEASLWQANGIVDAVRSLIAFGEGEGTKELRLLSEIVSTLLAELERESQDVRVEWVGEVPAIRVPYESVLIALHNLAKNAVAYSDPAEPDPWVRISCHHDDAAGRWVFTVTDNGVGIPEEEQRVIFQRFRRGASARGEGFGLGLSIVREAARQLSGTVAVESEPGEGSTFTLAFPDETARKPGS